MKLFYYSASLSLLVILAFHPLIILADENRTERSEPNFLILIADDAGMDFGCYGNSFIRTPNIDKLAESGLRCDKTFLTSPQCSPSRISILSGQYPHTTRTEDLHTVLPEGVAFITSYLREKGYFNGHNGKTHWGPNGDKQFDWYSQQFNDFDKFLESAKNKPFFFWTGFHDPHRSYQPGAISKPHNPQEVKVRAHLIDDEKTRKDIALYYDEIGRMDSVIGAYIEILKKEKLLKDTYIIFFSDNGAPFPREKGTLYDAGIQTPFIISGPEVPKGEIYDGLMSIIDLAPTILELAEIEKPDQMPGISFTPLLMGNFTLAPEYIFSERNWHDCDEHMRSIRTDQYKLILNAYTELPHGTAADLSNSLSWFSLLKTKDEGKLTDEQLLIFEVPRPAVELYDLINDPNEWKNLAKDNEYQEVINSLKQYIPENWASKSTYSNYDFNEYFMEK